MVQPYVLQFNLKPGLRDHTETADRDSSIRRFGFRFAGCPTLCSVRVLGAAVAGRDNRIDGEFFHNVSARSAGPARASDRIYAYMGDNRRARRAGMTIGHVDFHGDAGAVGTLCQSSSATRVLLLTTASHEVAPRLKCRFNVRHFAGE